MRPLTSWLLRRFPSAFRIPISAFALIAALCLSGCETSSSGPSTAADAAARATLMQSIASEPQGDYWIGRRYYNANYKFWGYIRRPRQSWKQAQLVVLNENSKYAPDRALSNVGIDNNSEYRIHGRFTGEIIYESASNAFYPEFIATSFELVNTNPTSIFPGGTRTGAEILKPDF